MFLRNVGGFYDTDVDFFLNAIWQDRKTLSMISAQTTFSGWSFALLALGEHMRWAGEVGVRKTGEQWGQLQTLSFRGMLASPSSEEVSCLSEICYDLPSYQFHPTEEDFLVSLVDSEDARAILETYNRRMLSSPDQDRLIVDNVSSILRFVTQDVMIDFRDFHPGFVKATGRWFWEEIDENGDSADFLLKDEKLVECVTYTLKFTRQSYFALGGANSKEIATLTKGLSEADFINLSGKSEGATHPSFLPSYYLKS
ncbi:hypothetical protein RhiJN_27367 [Ceratobasidium sp. AG-Ba]|nr:hypothetical protein RhiJN_13285 [Ceratobasidium sp. AG-Ba]QRV99348.1 hypothetical protein RhiJN_27367 [Ceratobasidium sp. AG-Ba]QRW13853.1 hypothetical protein RhiLY_12852 [Ceratobasidium sp. AG-Ba]